jgi:hypothetical protein
LSCGCWASKHPPSGTGRCFCTSLVSIVYAHHGLRGKPPNFLYGLLMNGRQIFLDSRKNGCQTTYLPFQTETLSGAHAGKPVYFQYTIELGWCFLLVPWAPVPWRAADEMAVILAEIVRVKGRLDYARLDYATRLYNRLYNRCKSASLLSIIYFGTPT